MSRIARFTLIAIGILILLLIVLPLLIPLSVYKGRVEGELSGALGRPLRIEGPLKLTIFPELGLKADQVVVANVPSGQAPYLARADEVRITARFRALFAGRIELSRVEVSHPDFRFEVDAQGRANWNVAPAQSRPSGILDRMKTSVAEVRLIDGTVRYEDVRSNTREDIQNLDATLTWFGKTLALDGEVTDSGERIAFVAKATDPTALVNAKSSHVDLSLTSDLVQASFKGALKLNGPADGTLKFDTPSLRKLAAWRGRGLPNVGGLGTFSIEAQLSRRDRGYTLSDLKLALDDTTMNGVLTVDNSQARSRLSGHLSLDRLAVDPYILPPGAKRNMRATAWDTAPFNLMLLTVFDADLQLEIAQLNIRSLTLQNLAFPLHLKQGVLDMRIGQFALNGGNGALDLTVDAAQTVPSFRARLNLRRFAAKPLLAATLGVTGLDGSGTLNLDATTRGGSVAAMIKGLWGRGDIMLENGRMQGADLELGGRAAHLGAPAAATAPAAAMRFTSLRGSFALARGVLHNEDFGLSNPIVEILGGGTVDLSARTLNFTFRPRARLERDERPMNTISDFSAPFSLSGAWTALRHGTASTP
ncbi:MAG TPA: AsmA family protein [Rhizomicrobium sp.]|nr:AsmA family protein [Rhizomicrobium sp.]